MSQFLEELMHNTLLDVALLGHKGKENIPPEEGVTSHRRNCRAEALARDKIVEAITKEYGSDFYLVIEGFNPVGNENSGNLFVSDPMDGTAYYARSGSLSPPNVTRTIAHIQGRNYSDVVASAVGNLMTGEVFSAQKSMGATSRGGRMKAGVNEGIHDPVFGSDFYFPENAAARLKLKHPINPEWNRFECLNTGSSAGMLVQLATGDLTAFFNLVGPTPWELAPGYLLIKEAGGYVLSADTGEELGSRPFNIDEKRVPIVAAYNEEMARKVLEQIRLQ